MRNDAPAGSNKLQLSEAVDWEVGMVVIVTSTSKNYDQLERHVIADIQDGGRTLITEENLEYLHICQSEELETGDTYSQCAEVGLLTRNIKISSPPSDEFYGGRLLIGLHVVLIDNMYYTFRGLLMDL